MTAETPAIRVILIHGAWAGSWVWDGLTEELARRGWDATALDLPGDGFHPIAPEDATVDDLLACVTDAIDAAPGPVALIGHSGGGMLVTAGATARPDRVTSAVWVAGMLLPDGRTFDDIEDAVAGSGHSFGVTPHIRPSADGLTSTVSAEAGARYFFHDAEPDVAAAAAARLTAQPSSGHRLRTQAGPEFAAMPKLYVLATDDRSVLPEAQRLMCEGVEGLTVVEIDTGHAPQLTKTAELAEQLDDWLSAH